MNLTSKSRYALKIMMDLAYHHDLPHVQRQDIAARQGIPTTYLDQIMVKLRSGKLVESIRGRGGGYRIAKPAHDISVWEIFKTVEDCLYPVECVEEHHNCMFEQACIAKSAWEVIFVSLKRTLETLNLDQLVKDTKLFHLCPIGGLKECKAGKNDFVVNDRSASVHT